MSTKNGPLEYLSQMLRDIGPPSLAVILARINQLEDFKEFVDIIRQYLPEREAEIFHERAPWDQMAVFARHFEERYFPLDDMIREGAGEEYRQLTYRIPVPVHGMSWEEYEEIPTNSRDGVQLITYLCESPYTDTDIRTSLGEACKKLVPESLLMEVPDGGFNYPEFSQLLKGSRYEGVLKWIEYCFQDTGNPFQDIDYETYGYTVLPEWEPDEVESLTRLYKESELINQAIHESVKWLEKDLVGHFMELLGFLLNTDLEVNGAKKPPIILQVGATWKPGSAKGQAVAQARLL